MYLSWSVAFFISLISKFKQTKPKQHESGGVLLGQVKKNCIYITRISFPSSNDKSSRYSFWRNKKNAQSIIDYEFYNSGGTVIYIGEWHTHPENHPSPSSIDINMIKTQFKKNKINETFLIMIIVGLKGYYFGFYDGENLYKLNKS